MRTAGVMSMHGWPGLVGWIAGVIKLLPLNQDFLTGDRQSANLEYYVPWENVLQHQRGNGDAATAQVCFLFLVIDICMHVTCVKRGVFVLMCTRNLIDLIHDFCKVHLQKKRMLNVAYTCR
jgi:hypothetical protein